MSARQLRHVQRDFPNSFGKVHSLTEFATGVHQDIPDPGIVIDTRPAYSFVRLFPTGLRQSLYSRAGYIDRRDRVLTGRFYNGVIDTLETCSDQLIAKLISEKGITTSSLHLV